MIALQKTMRGDSCILSFIEDGLGIGSIEISEVNSSLIPQLENLLDAYNRSKLPEEAATVTGKKSFTRGDV